MLRNPEKASPLRSLRMLTLLAPVLLSACAHERPVPVNVAWTDANGARLRWVHAIASPGRLAVSGEVHLVPEHRPPLLRIEAAGCDTEEVRASLPRPPHHPGGAFVAELRCNGEPGNLTVNVSLAQ